MSDTTYILRPAQPDDLATLSEIERAADSRFAEAGVSVPSDNYAPGSYDRPDGITVAVETSTGEIVGFIQTEMREQGPHIAELSVLPAHGQQGLGARLVHHVVDAAEQAGEFSVTLSTFINVPFNGPFYEHQGFEAVSPMALGGEYVTLRQNEAAAGLDITQRQFMVRYLNPVSRNEPAS